MFYQNNSLKLLSKISSVFKKTNKIFIYGIYGVGNLGDEAILKGILKQLNFIEDYQKIIISKRPDFIYKDYKKPSIHPILFKMSASLLKRRTNNSLLIIGGGGIFKDYESTPNTLKKFLRVSMRAGENGYKTMVYSAGVENLRFNESKQHLKNILNKFDLITVRDPYSKRRLEAIGVQKKIYVTGDPAVLLFSDFKKCTSTIQKRPHITINLRHWYEKGYFTTNEKIFTRFISNLADSLDILVENYNAFIHFIPFRTMFFDNDLEIIKRVLSAMRYKEKTFIYEKVPNFNELKKIFYNTDITIGMRLHSLLFSFASLKPMIAISYSTKVKDFMKYLEMNKYCFDIKDINSQNLMKLIDEIKINRQKLQNHLYEKRSQYLNNLEINTSLLKKLL